MHAELTDFKYCHTLCIDMLYEAKPIYEIKIIIVKFSG